MAKFNEHLKNNLFTPEFCFVDIDNKDTLQKFINGEIPTKVVKTPNGFHLYFEDRVKTAEELLRLAKLYNGDVGSAKITQQLYSVGTVLEGFTYYEINSLCWNNYVGS